MILINFNATGNLLILLPVIMLCSQLMKGSWQKIIPFIPQSHVSEARKLFIQTLEPVDQMLILPI